MRKLVFSIFPSNGFTELMIPDCFASTSTPGVPVILRSIFSANLLPFRSSMINNGFSNSKAKAIALASPLSNVAEISCWYSKFFGFLTKIQSGRGFPYSSATSCVVKIIPNSLFRSSISSILLSKIIQLASEIIVLCILNILL